MEAVEELTAFSTPLGTAGHSKASRMALLGRSRHPLPDIVLYLKERKKKQLFSTLKHLKCMYFEFENVWLPIV